MNEHLDEFADDDGYEVGWRDSRYGVKVRDAIYDALASSSASGAERMREAAAKVAYEEACSLGENAIGGTIAIAIRALPLPDPVPAWRDIATAPKDGTYVLLNFDNRPPTVARWLYGAWQAFDVLGFIGAPTHWQPLPLPPTEISDNG